MSDVLHRRYLATGGIAAKPTPARSGNAIGHLSGYAAVFDTLSHDLGGWRERIAPGAFAAAIRSSKHPILALYDHAVGHLLASTRAGTLTLSEDKIGLRFTIALPDTTLGRDVMALVRRGDLSGASIGFVMDKRATDWVKAPDGGAVSVIRRVKTLHEISVVALPAYPTAYTQAAAARPETPAQARCRAAVEKMRLAMAEAVA